MSGNANKSLESDSEGRKSRETRKSKFIEEGKEEIKNIGLNQDLFEETDLKSDEPDDIIANQPRFIRPLFRLLVITAIAVIFALWFFKYTGN